MALGEALPTEVGVPGVALRRVGGTCNKETGAASLSFIVFCVLLMCLLESFIYYFLSLFDDSVENENHMND